MSSLRIIAAFSLALVLGLHHSMRGGHEFGEEFCLMLQGEPPRAQKNSLIQSEAVCEVERTVLMQLHTLAKCMGKENWS